MEPRRGTGLPRLTRRQLLLAGGATGLAAAAGGFAFARARKGASASSISLVELADKSFDVCVIGSGPAGAVLAQRLVDRGVSTVVLESGVALERMAEPGWQPAPLDAYAAPNALGYPLHATRMRALGGSSNLWTGRCSRLHPLDFAPNAYTPKDNPWPLGYEELEPYYARAESTLRVSGGPLSEFHAPRKKALGGSDAGNHEAVQEFLQDLDLTLDPSPSSHAPLWRNGPVRAGRDLLPSFAQSASGALVTDATVTRLVTDAAGQVRAAHVRGRPGEERKLEAEVFVIACGAIESARLLLLSASDHHENGLGNAGGWVGRGFNEHPNLSFVGDLTADSPGDGLARCHQFYDAPKLEGYGSAIFKFQTKARQPRRLWIGVTLEMLSDPMNRVTLSKAKTDVFGSPGLELAMRWTQADLATLKATRERVAGLFAKAGASGVEEKSQSWSHHQMGTCRMGTNPETSVVDANLRVHGTGNLFVVSSGVFVTGGAAHPTLAIVALAHRLADHLKS